MNKINESTILIVDDTPENIDILVDLLEDYEKKIAINGLDALETVHSGDLPDLILLDIMMPEMDGYEVCKKLREDEKTKDIPVIFLTAKTQKKDINKGFEVGGQDYVTKPFDAAELLHRVNTQLTLKKQKDELYELNHRLDEKVKERTFELNIAKEKAEESDRLKSEFLQSISHEIRTPLNAVVGFSGFISDGNENPELEDFAGFMKKQTDLLLKLVNDIVDFAKLESRSVSFDYELVDVNEILEDNFLLFNSTKPENVELEYQQMESQNEIITDKFHLDQIVLNLISNALKFTTQGKVIYGANIKENNEIEFYVTDTGKGIPKEEQALIFERFYKVDSFTQGAGLGLAIVKNTVDLLGGKIQVESEPEKGSRFSFVIPFQISEDQMAFSGKQALHTKAKKLMKNLNILIAEDELSNTIYYKEIFKEYDHHIDYAKNGEEAVKMHSENKYDLILMDIKMPVMNGLEAIEKMKETDQETPIIAISAYAYQEDIKKAMNAGCNTFVSKPFTKYKLINTILDFV